MLRTLPLAVLLVFISSFAAAQDWPAIRGPNGTGNVTTNNGILTSADSFKLRTRWKRELGSGYSSVVVAAGKVVTMYTDGSDDRVICLNASDGETVWDIKTGPFFKGENGSFDGPLSTPLIHDNRVYAITAVGKLHCLDLADGHEHWAYDLPEKTGVTKPLYGFVTSPIVVGNTLIVQAGGPDKALIGLDRVSGEEKWAVGNDVINSQTPSTIQLGPGSPTLVLAAGGKNLSAVHPDTGEILMEFAHQGGNGQAMTPVDLGDGKVLMTLDDRHSTTVKLTAQSDQKVNASPEWKERSIKNTYNIPVFSNGGVFAYSTRILTCVNPETGRAFWKTREPGDGFLITVDGHMIINTKKGSLHLAKADKSAYQEIAELNLFDDLVWSVPAYSENSVFARSLGEIARVDIVASGEKTAVASSALPLGKDFSTLLTKIERAKDDDSKSKLVGQWMESQKQFPVIQDGIAHFIYLGDETDVALAGDFLGARQEKKMKQVAGTNLHYYTLEFRKDQRANYCFLLDFKPTLDALNPRQMTSTMYAGEMEFAVRLRGQEPLKMSWFAMSEWNQPEYLKDLDDVEVTIESHDVPLGDDDETSKIDVLLPPGYDGEKAFPVAYVFDGGMGRTRGDMDKALTKLFTQDASKAAIVVFLTGGGPAFTEQLATKIVPFIDEKFNTRAERKSRLVIGFGFSGTPALVAGAMKNDVFGNAAAQSPLAFADAERMILQSMSQVETATQVHLQWGRFDMYNPHENWDLRSGTEKIFQAIGENENVTVSGGMVNDSTDWSSWKNRYHEIFGLLDDKK